MTELPEFQADATARTAHASLRRSLAVAESAQHSAVLWFAEIQRRGLYRQLGYSSMHLYATECLGFSRAKTGDFTRLAAGLERLPKLRESVARGEVGYTKAREVIKVATPRTEERWLDEAVQSNRKQLAAKVARVRKKAAARRMAQPELLPAARVERELEREIPQRVALEMSPEQFARWEALWEKLRKLGITGDRTDELLEALGTLVDITESEQRDNEKPAPRGASPAATIHIHECPKCSRAAIQTSSGEKAVDPGRHRGDATILEPGKRARSAIPPRIRREVLERDRYRCRMSGCTHTRFLEIHHERPVGRNGGDHPDNLVTLCSACHRVVHGQVAAGHGKVISSIRR